MKSRGVISSTKNITTPVSLSSAEGPSVESPTATAITSPAPVQRDMYIDGAMPAFKVPETTHVYGISHRIFGRKDFLLALEKECKVDFVDRETIADRDADVWIDERTCAV